MTVRRLTDESDSICAVFEFMGISPSNISDDSAEVIDYPQR